MPVNIIISTTFEEAKRETLRRIDSNNEERTSHLVLVPDRHSLSYQRAVIEELGLTSVTNIEVSSFSRLADLNIDKSKRYLTPQASVMLMRKAINAHKKELLRYASSANKVGFADEMFAVVSDMRNSGITPEMLAEKLKFINNIPIKNKTHDIELLYRSYMQELTEKYLDATSKFDALLNVIGEIDAVRNSYVYVSDYYTFTNPELKLLERIMSLSKEVNISLVEKDHGSNRRIFPKTSAKLISIAESLEQSVSVERNKAADDGNRMILDNLFGYQNDKEYPVRKDVLLYEADNVEQELTFIGALINKSVREKGIRYKDIALAVSDVETYKDEINRVFGRLRIPYYIDDKIPILKAVSVKFVVAALNTALSGYRKSDVTDFISNGLMRDITYKERDVFTNYLAKFNIDRSRFLGDFTLGEGETLDALNETRRKIFKGFDILEKSVEKRKMSEHIDNVLHYLDEIDYIGRINAFARKEYDEGFIIESEITKQAPKKLFRFFEEMKMVGGDEVMDLKEFRDVMLAGLVRVSISLIPKFGDSVYIGDVSESRYDEVKEMYFAGMSQDKVPKDASGHGIIGSQENEVYSSLDISITPSPKDKNLLGRFYLLELLLKAKDRIVVGYSLENGGKKSKSIVIKELEKIYSLKTESVAKLFEMSVPDSVSTLGNALYVTAKNYGEFSDKEAFLSDGMKKLASYLKDSGKFVPFDYNDERYVRGLCGVMLGYDKEKGMGNLSASRLENYFKCPYMAYMQYAVGVKDREVAEMNVADSGTVIHAILEKLYAESKSVDLSRAELKARTEELFDTVMKENYPYIYADAELSRVVDDLRKRAVFVVSKIHGMLDNTDFVPIKTEYRFDGRIRVYAGKRFRLRGSIDRVDACGDKFYIVDYKSASDVKFKLGQIYYGERIQLVIYLSELMKDMDGESVGIFYLPMPSGYRKRADDENPYSFRGIISSNDAEDMVKKGQTNRIFPFKETKSGVKGNANGEAVAKDEFIKIIEYTDRLIDNAIKDIDDGYIGKSPVEGKCEYCKYSCVCDIYSSKINMRKPLSADIDTINGALKEHMDE